MKKTKNLLFILLLITVSVCALSFSAGAEYITHNYWEYDPTFPDPVPPYLNSGGYADGIYRYSFDPETGLLVIERGEWMTGILPRYLLNGVHHSDPWLPEHERISYEGIEIDKDKIKHIIIKNGFSEIYETFRDLKNLETIVLPDSLRIIGPKSFENCSSLKNFVLPSWVTYVGKQAFDGCDSLTKVYYEGKANLDLPGDAALPDKIDWFEIHVDKSGVSLQWEDGDEYADYYRIYRWDYKQKKWITVANHEKQEGYLQSYRYKCKTVPGEKYRFAVRPVNVNGSDTKWNDFTAAEAVYLIPLQLKATALTGGYKLTWNKVPGAMGYQIWYSTKVNGTYKRYKNAYTESFTKTGLKKGTTYYFQVRPVAELSNGTYQVGEFSAPVKVTVK